MTRLSTPVALFLGLDWTINGQKLGEVKYKKKNGRERERVLSSINLLLQITL